MPPDQHTEVAVLISGGLDRAVLCVELLALILVFIRYTSAVD